MASLPTVGGSDGTWGAELNSYLTVGHNADGTHKLNDAECAKIYRSASGAFTSGAVVPFDTEAFATSGMTTDVVTNRRITVTKAGIYLVGGSLGQNDLGNLKSTTIRIRVNGSAVAYDRDINAGVSLAQGYYFSTSTLVSLSANDYIDLYVTTDSTDKDMFEGEGYTYLYAYQVRTTI